MTIASLRNERGYTLFELTISSAILSVILLLLSSAFISLVHMERSAVSLRDVIQSTRVGLDDMTTETRAATSFEVPAVDPYATTGFSQVCLYESGTMVQYFTDPIESNGHHGLYKVNLPLGSACTAIVDYASAVNPTSVLSADVYISAFRVWAPAAGSNVPLLTVRLGTTTTTDLGALQGPAESSPGNCRDTSPYCAVSLIETSISLRGIQ
jgi:prepilin-type N-terminal cleavage/methylation domain-containing protein